VAYLPKSGQACIDIKILFPSVALFARTGGVTWLKGKLVFSRVGVHKNNLAFAIAIPENRH